MCIRIPVLLLFLWSSIVQAQELVLRHIDEERGLPSNCVLDLFVDSEGLIWVATNNGLYRYDGFTYERMGVGTGLDEVNVVHMREFPDHDLFVFAGYGMRLFLMQEGRIREVLPPADGPVWGDNGAVSSIAMDATGELVLGFSNTVGRAHVDLGTARMRLDPLLSDGYAGHVTLVNGQLSYWLGNVGASTYLQDTIELPGYTGTLRSSRIQGDHVLRCGTLQKGGYWILHGDALKFVLAGYEEDTVLQQRILGITEDRRGRLWIRHWPAGLSCLDGHLQQVPIRSAELDGSHITACVEDLQGGLWFGTIDRGLFYCASPDVRSLSARRDLGSPTVSSSRTIGAEEVLIGTSNGQVFGWDGIDGPTPYMVGHRAIGNMDVKGVYISTDGKLYPGRLDRSLDLASGAIEAHIGRNHNWVGIYDVLAITAHKLLLATVHGVQVADLERPEQTFQVLGRSYRCNRMIADGADGCYVATQKGLFRISMSTLQAERYPEALLRIRTNDILEAGDSLWVATSAGLVLRTSSSVTRPFPNGVLGERSVRALAIQQHRWLWVATMDGLYQVDLRMPQQPPRRYGRAQGLPSDSFTSVAVQGDRIWAITGAEVCSFRLGDFLPPSPSSPLRILSILGNDSLASDPAGRFPNTVEQVGIRLRHPDHARFHRTPFRYRTGPSAPWTTISEPRIELVGLAPGAYTVEVQAIGSDGDWGGTVLAQWSIASPVWQQPWAIALFSIIAVILVVAATSYYRARQHREQLLAAQVQHYHHKALLAQMEPHFLYNALNSIQGFVASNDSAAATRYIARFAKLMRGLLNAAHNDHITLREEMDTLEHYCALEALRSQPPFSYHIEADGALLPELVQIPSFVVQPYVENAIRHGLRNLPGERNGRLLVRFVREGRQQLRCIIEDNGVGRDQARSITSRGSGWRSLGTRINLERSPLLDRMGRPISINTEDLTDTNGRACGTRVVVIVPLRMLAPRIERNGANDVENTDRG